jgi:putative ABC transport system permease protein
MLPNHFLVNVAPYELDGVRQLVEDNQLDTAGWYAMVRGRMTEINGVAITEEQKDSHESFRRELNLSWTTELPEGNTDSSRRMVGILMSWLNSVKKRMKRGRPLLRYL